MKYLYENKIIDELEVRKILSEKGFEDIRNNMSDYILHNCNFEDSDINVAINGSMERVLDYLADYDIEIKEAEFNKFQGVVLLNIETSIIRVQNLKDKIKEIVYNLTEIEDLGIKNLAYDIKKNNKAYYIEFHFEDNSENIADLERYFRINDDVLKFIIIKEED